jgi:hypothetical protein
MFFLNERPRSSEQEYVFKLWFFIIDIGSFVHKKRILLSAATIFGIVRYITLKG